MDDKMRLTLEVQGSERTAEVEVFLKVDKGDEESAAKLMSAVFREALFRLGLQQPKEETG
jgi:hypothetical protein